MSTEFTVDVDVRYRDLDPFDHVNNAVYATYLEEARTEYLKAVLTDGEMEYATGLEEFPFVLASLELSFGRPITLDDRLTVAVETAALGETSWTLAYDIRSNDESVATGETTIVFVDREEKRPVPIDDGVRQRILEWTDLEPEA